MCVCFLGLACFILRILSKPTSISLCASLSMFSPYSPLPPAASGGFRPQIWQMGKSSLSFPEPWWCQNTDCERLVTRAGWSIVNKTVSVALGCGLAEALQRLCKEVQLAVPVGFFHVLPGLPFEEWHHRRCGVRNERSNWWKERYQAHRIIKICRDLSKLALDRPTDTKPQSKCLLFLAVCSSLARMPQCSNDQGNQSDWQHRAQDVA